MKRQQPIVRVPPAPQKLSWAVSQLLPHALIDCSLASLPPSSSVTPPSAGSSPLPHLAGASHSSHLLSCSPPVCSSTHSFYPTFPFSPSPRFHLSSPEVNLLSGSSLLSELHHPTEWICRPSGTGTPHNVCVCVRARESVPTGQTGSDGLQGKLAG